MFGTMQYWVEFLAANEGDELSSTTKDELVSTSTGIMQSKC